MVIKSRFSSLSIISALVVGAALPALGFRVSKSDFPRFVGIISCKDDGSACEGAETGFLQQGLAGEGDFQEASSPDLAKDSKAVIGFLEGKPFSWGRYGVDYPNAKTKWIVLNELTIGEGNRSFLTQWKAVKDSLEFVKVEPHYFSLGLGELFIQGKATLPDGSLLLILKGEGSDAGINVQDFRMVRVPSAAGPAEEIVRRDNHSEIPIQKILEKINADEAVDPVQDSVLSCDIAAGKKAPSGGPLIRCVKSHATVLYTKDGPQETPGNQETENLDIWKTIKSSPKSKRK